eukprot:CAMPEP_0206296106 /NCGR_PEP_ID=MMETSP0106_2-20121207/5502_1 /ASSEMBLY_ACC=CAM_ASM_000206 /TAXON_ID=81532 /ORGANISM="Acanthoeca-like sp., Strain 10tr" /LENGTH=113 /DNA_ID=CAMNT_0053726763 /DNA_START=409 /DNA_END=748 /DNA_ORIENTATION=-
MAEHFHSLCLLRGGRLSEHSRQAFALVRSVDSVIYGRRSTRIASRHSVYQWLAVRARPDAPVSRRSDERAVDALGGCGDVGTPSIRRCTDNTSTNRLPDWIADGVADNINTNC